MTILHDEVLTISAGTTSETVSVDMTDALEASETISTAAVTLSSPTTGIAISGAGPNASTYVDARSGETVAVNKAVQWTIDSTSASEDTDYDFLVVATTSAGRTPQRLYRLRAM